jgi:hypothetical protein
MRDFLIAKPPEGKTTCSLLLQHYTPGDGRGKKTYIGSVNLAVNPAELPAGINLNPGVVLDDWQLAQVKAFLTRHGTYGQPPKMKPEVLERVRAIVRAEVEQEMKARKPGQFEGAVKALDEAAQFLSAEASRLRGAGVRLSPGMLGTVACEPKSGATELDLLKVKANRVRFAFQQFENALKGASLMKSVTRAEKKKSLP